MQCNIFYWAIGFVTILVSGFDRDENLHCLLQRIRDKTIRSDLSVPKSKIESNSGLGIDH